MINTILFVLPNRIFKSHPPFIVNNLTSVRQSNRIMLGFKFTLQASSYKIILKLNIVSICKTSMKQDTTKAQRALICSTSIPGGNQVDGLPPVSSNRRLEYLLKGQHHYYWSYCSNQTLEQSIIEWRSAHLSTDLSLVYNRSKHGNTMFKSVFVCLLFSFAFVLQRRCSSQKTPPFFNIKR